MKKQNQETKVSNLAVCNETLAAYLSKAGLVCPSDITFELTKAPLHEAVTVRLHDNKTKSIFISDGGPTGCVSAWMDNKAFSGTKNFICNGQFVQVRDCLFKVLTETDSFNIGICTENPELYQSGKRFYKGIHRLLLSKGLPVKEIEETLEAKTTEPVKMYLLSYQGNKCHK